MDYKQQILEALQAKFKGGNAGVLGWIATQLAKTVTAAEQVQTAVDGITQEYVSMMESYGDNRATSSAQTAVTNYEAKHGLKDGKAVQKPAAQQQQAQQQGAGTQQPVTQPQGGANEVPAWAQTLIDSNKTLTERLAKFETERTTTTRKSQLSSIVAKLPEKLRKPYERIALDSLSDEEFNTLVTDVTGEVDGILGDMRSKGAVFGQPAAPNGGGGTKATDAEVDAVVAMLNI